MIILGVDTAIRCTGYSVIAVNSINDIKVLDCGVIKNPAKAPHSECLRRISGGIREIINKYDPDIASIEEAFYSRNVKTAMILSLARGAAIAVLAEAGKTIYQYSPKTAKRAVTGSGSASKQQVAKMASAMFGLDIDDIPDDATDALALALCHGQIATRKELSFLLPEPV